MWRRRFTGGDDSHDSGVEIEPEDRYFSDEGDFRFTKDLVKSAIVGTPAGKTYDSSTCGIRPEMYHNDATAECLSIAFNHLCTREVKQPDGPVFKFYLRPTLKDARKPDEIPKSYRPISISGLILVFYERVLSNYMATKVETVLPELSLAYRPQRGTSLAILKLKLLLQRRGAIVFFLDASDAFGCIKWPKLFEILDTLGFDRNLTAAISRLYQLSCGRVVWRNCSSETFVLTSGVRQGGCISGHLFNVYFSKLDIAGSRGIIIFYADDLVIITFHPWAAVCLLDELRILSIALNINWNPDKCKVLQMSSTQQHVFRWYDKALENVSKFIYLGWIIVRKLRNCDDEQAIRQAARFYAAAHETSQAYQFTRQLPWLQRVNFAKTFGGLYAPEAFTSVSNKVLSKLKAAHRYLYMRLTGWQGEECFDEEATVSSLSIHSEDSNEEYYDTRSRWLYAYAAAAEKSTVYQKVRTPSATGTIIVDHLKPAPHIEYQFRVARFRVQQTMERLQFPLDLKMVRLTPCIRKAVASIPTKCTL